MADINKVIRVGDTLTNIIDSLTKKSVNYRKVTTWYDGSPMTNDKVDGVLYRKKGSEYFRQVIDKDGELFLEKDTMAQMRALTNVEILFLKAGVYKGVQLNGYYSKGDTPAPIQYFISQTADIDDGGSVIGVGDIKLEHVFEKDVNVLYFGASKNLLDNSVQINKAIGYCSTKSQFAIELPPFELKNTNNIEWLPYVIIKGSGRSSLLSFTDSMLDGTNGRYIEGHNFRIERNGVPGYAWKLGGALGTGGTFRTFFNNVTISKSSGKGLYYAGGYLTTFVNLYVRECEEEGVVIDNGEFQTGANSVTFLGGEIQSNTLAGIVLERCKQVNILGMCIEGNGVGIGIGASVISLNIQTYFEANSDGHIMPYTTISGGNTGVAQCVVIQGGSYFLRGVGSTMSPDLSINIPNCRSFYINDGVLIQGYSLATEPIISVKDVGDSNRAVGYIGQITTDAPAGLTFSNLANNFGRRHERNFFINEAMSDTIMQELKLPINDESIRKNYSVNTRVVVNLECVTAGNYITTFYGFDKNGASVISATNFNTTVVVGYNRMVFTLPSRENIAYISFRSRGDQAGSTAKGIKIISIDVITNENLVKNV